jgi:hypothetical protein
MPIWTDFLNSISWGVQDQYPLPLRRHNDLLQGLCSAEETAETHAGQDGKFKGVVDGWRHDW